MKIKTTKSENNIKKGGQCYEFINQELILTSPCEMRIRKGSAISGINLTGGFSIKKSHGISWKNFIKDWKVIYNVSENTSIILSLTFQLIKPCEMLYTKKVF